MGAEIGNPVRDPCRLEQRPGPLLGSAIEHREAGIADASARKSDCAEECVVGSRIGNETEVGQQILYLAPLVEADCADQSISNPCSPKRFLQGARLRIGPVQHGHFAIAPLAASRSAAHLADDPLGLVALVRGRQQRYLLSALPTGA